jgi:hypothetical protein
MKDKRDVFIESFLAYQHLHTAMAPIIPVIVEMALSMLSSDLGDEAHDFASQLGFLITWFDWNDGFSDDQGPIFLAQFSAKTTPQQRAATFSEIIRCLNRSKKPLDREIQSKLEAFFVTQLQAIRTLVESNVEHEKIEPELTVLVGLLGCNGMNDDWSIDFTLEALSLTNNPINVNLPTMALRELVLRSKQRVKIFDIITALTQQTSSSNNWSLQNKELENFVFTGLASKDAAEQKAAKRTQDALLKLGLSNYKNPLP